MRMNLMIGKKKMNKKKNEWNALYFWGVSFSYMKDVISFVFSN